MPMSNAKRARTDTSVERAVAGADAIEEPIDQDLENSELEERGDGEESAVNPFTVEQEGECVFAVTVCEAIHLTKLLQKLCELSNQADLQGRALTTLEFNL